MKNYISFIYWTSDEKWCWQKVGGIYRLYDYQGDFHKEFASLEKMEEYIKDKKGD